jgi:mannobiose 2-epimerase
MSLFIRSFLLVILLISIIAKASAQEPEAASLRTRIDSLLREELTKHWYPQAIDKELGGFHQNFSRDWSPLPDDNRFLVYQARMTWTAAAFARYSESDRKAFLGHARYGIEYLDKTMRDAESGGFHFVLDAHGKVDPKLGTEKHVYGTSFVLYAASEAYEVTHDPLALKVARDSYEWLDSHAHDPEFGGYLEALTREGTPILKRDDSAPVSRRVDRLGVYYGFKSMNSHIHLLEAVAAYYRVEKTPAVERRLRELLGIVRDKIAAEPGALNLYLTRDWRPAPAHDSFGHDVETAYLLVEAAEALGQPDDETTWRVARRLVDHALDWGWDSQDGGFFDKGDVFAAGPYDTTKVWWTQAEGLNALLLMHTRFGSQTDRYWKAFLKQWSFIEAHQLDPEHGGWYGEVTRDGRRIGDGRKASQWKANYHTARAMMNVARALEKVKSGPTK